jgi:hypothetical protein
MEITTIRVGILLKDPIKAGNLYTEEKLMRSLKVIIFITNYVWD